MTKAATAPRAAAAAMAALAVASCSGGTRDALAPSRDIVVDAGPAASAGTYEYVARRPLGVVALAEARGLPAAASRAAIDHLADALDACVTDQAHGGAPPRGAARVVAQLGDDGGIANVSLRVDPGGNGGNAAATVALLCLVAPVKLLSFPLADGGARGLAIEALWGQPSAAAQP
jgi:hypothetical protein